ncbi:MAG: hypothetical protein OXI77_17110 [Chloroflexota bacterium]|nr:hypothetical protein [Chloroflexota bacterium]MDE2911261.1 hypothetical protein [Chloroflexota bacterium]
MVIDEPQNDSSQQGEFVESITLASLLENPDPDFDVVVAKFSKEMPGGIERAPGETRPAPPKTENGQP